jgi:tRNA A-37 threonylcarbamoyl transferase component Bud32
MTITDVRAPEVRGEPERLGAYTLLEKLGAGGMAVVYRGERLGEAGFKKRVALKRILPQYRRDPSLLERFAAEARTNARLDHPNLVQVLDFGIDPEPYLVLEYVEGVSLSQVMQRLLEKKEKLELPAALFIVAEAALGLDHAHRKRNDDGTPLGIVHRDVSPQNVLLSNEGAVKVSDFGLVKAADNVLKTASGVSIGKISYMAPEQAAGVPIDARADVFALGVTLWELLTLESLIPPNDPALAAQMLQSGTFRKPSELRPDVPPEVDEVVMRCLALDPEQRMPSMQQLSLELREIGHAAVAGYGRQQLARLLLWLFPEKGWALAEPDRPIAQPSAEERASIFPVTPAAVAMQREAPPEPPPPVPEAVRRTIDSDRPSAMSTPAIVTRAPRWLMAVAALGLFTSGMLAVVLVLVLGYFGWSEARTREDGLVFESVTPGTRVWLGPREVGPLPLTLTTSDLTGEPIIAMAPGHGPVVVRAERIVELVRGPHPNFVFDLELSQHPDLMVYVRYDGQGIAHLPSGDDVGGVPGVVRIPRHPGEVNPTTLAIWDESGHETFTLDLTGCIDTELCILSAGVVSPLP